MIKKMIKGLPPIKRILDERDNLVAQRDNLLVQIEHQASKENSPPNYYDGSFPLECRGRKDESFLRMPKPGIVDALVPIDLLFSESTAMAKAKCENPTPEWELIHSVNSDVPVSKMTTHIALYNYFRNGDTFPQIYFDWRRDIHTSRGLEYNEKEDYLLNFRYQHFIHMQRRLNTSYFENNPCECVWNSRGYFNLLDGHHRAAFLYTTGVMTIPCRMSLENYLKWRNDAAVEELIAAIEETNRKEFYTPIWNPYFMTMETYRESFSKSRLHHIGEYFAGIDMAGKSVLDIGANMAYMSQHFYREGAEVTCIEPDPQHFEMAKKMQKLFGTGCHIIEGTFESVGTKTSFNIGIMLTVFYHFMGKDEIRDEFIKNINSMVSEYLIWESGSDYNSEREYLLEHTNFDHFTHLAYTYATGKKRQLGIFSKQQNLSE